MYFVNTTSQNLLSTQDSFMFTISPANETKKEIIVGTILGILYFM